MSDAASPSAPPPPLTDTTRQEVQAIADWCEGQRDHAEKMAGAQIRVVWILLLGGLILLLILPRLLQEIDFAWQKDSLPPAILESFRGTTASIEGNLTEMVQQKADADKELERVVGEHAELEEIVADLVAELGALLDGPYRIWHASPHTGLPEEFEVLDLKVTRGEEVIVTGRIPGPADDKGAPGTDLGFVLHRVGDGIWAMRNTEGPDGSILSNLVMPGTDRVPFLIAGGPFRQNSIFGSDNLSDWEPLWPTAAVRGVQIQGAAKAPEGPLIAVGYKDADRAEGRALEQLILRSEDGAEWTEISTDRAKAKNVVGLVAITADADGYVVAGWEGESITDVELFVLRSNDGLSWERDRILEPISSDDARRIDLVGDVGGTLYASTRNSEATRGGQIYFYDIDKQGWAKFDRSFDAITDLAELSNGSILQFASNFDRRGSRIEIGTLGDPETAFALEVGGRFLPERIIAAAELPDGRLLAGGSGFLIETLNNEDRKVFVDLMLSGSGLPDNMIVAAPPGQLTTPTGYTSARLRELGEARIRLASVGETLAARQQVADSAAATHARQIEIQDDFDTLTEALTAALRTSETPRQLAQIATRLAIIALLIYLVQIVVNRYRYLQRLAGFYQARSQAFRLLAASPDSSLLTGVTLADVTAMLSPDAIGFDKSAEPPTGQMVSLLQAGLKRS